MFSSKFFWQPSGLNGVTLRAKNARTCQDMNCSLQMYASLHSSAPQLERVLRGHDSLQVEMHRAHENRKLFLILKPESTFVSLLVLCTVPQLSCQNGRKIYYTRNRNVNRRERRVRRTYSELY
jgi:hypothetical protein